jgi:hypothetical protein
MNQAEQQERAAHHEAAHAVVACYFNHPVISVEVRGDSGCCVFPPEFQVRTDDATSRELTRREAVSQIVIRLCAGKHATRRWREGWSSKRYADYGWNNSDDRAQAFKHCLELSGGDEIEAQLLLNLLSHRAGKLVKEQWAAISSGAYKLVEFGKLNGDQVRGLLAHGRNGSNGQ